MKLRPLFVAIGWAFVATIIWLSVTPHPIDLGVEQGDKLGHLAAYGGTMWWFCQLYRAPRTRLFYAIGLVGLGVGLEYVQRALGYRTFEIADMIADALGVLLGWAVALAMPRLLK